MKKFTLKALVVIVALVLGVILQALKSEGELSIITIPLMVIIGIAIWAWRAIDKS